PFWSVFFIASSATSRIGNSAPPMLTGSGTVRVSSVSRGASTSDGMRSTSNPVRRLRGGDFQGNSVECGIGDNDRFLLLYGTGALVPFRVTQVFVLHLCHFLNQEDLMEREAMVQNP